MKAIFINEAFDKAINDYLISNNDEDSKIYNSFLVVMIRLLANIYGELDIINPYYTYNEDALKENMAKFKAPASLIDSLMLLLDMYYKIELRNESSLNREENIYFVDVQKKIIDLFIYKKNNYLLNDNEYKEFFDLLYTPAASNPLRISYNYLNARDIYEVATYYQTRINEEKKNMKITPKELLNLDVYKLFNYKLGDISLMNNEEVKQLNSRIYSTLNINESAINKDYLLDEAIKNITGETNKVTTGNGYVDILLIMSVIITAVMVLVIFTCVVF